MNSEHPRQDDRITHPAEETTSSILLHAWLPAIAASIVFAISVIADLASPARHWAQRAGAVITVLGAYVDAKKSFKFIDGKMFMNFALPYRTIAVVLVVFGTLVWGYGDLLL